jgi:hypothetical protein
MKNLLERAKPELRQAIDSFKSIYPNTTSKLERTLSENIFVSELTFETLSNMKMVIKDNGLPFDMNNPWAYFEDSL